MSIKHYYYTSGYGRGKRYRRAAAAKSDPGAKAFAVLLILAFLAFLYVMFRPQVNDWATSLFSGIQAQFAQNAPADTADAADASEDADALPEGALVVRVLDVGQGDSSFLRSPNGKTMLIDTGEYGNWEMLDSFLQAQNVKKLDVVVASHPHSDHIGCMARLIRHYKIGTFYLPLCSNTSQSYSSMLQALEDKRVPVRIAYGGKDEVIDWDTDVSARILSPLETASYPDINENSIVLNVRFGGSAMLFPGDAGTYAEGLLYTNLPPEYLRANVLKIGHHGSSDATGPTLLKAVAPQIAVISCGADNDFGHPHASVLTMLKKRGITVYRTDKNGAVTLALYGDGRVEVQTER